MWAEVSTENSDIQVVANGLSVAPFLGFKKIWPSGFTFDAQLGVSYSVFAAEADSGESAEGSNLGALVNLNIGWSF